MTDRVPAGGNGAELVVAPSPRAAAELAARRIVDGIAEAIAARGVAHWATTGGSAAPALYEQLVTAPLRDQVDWSRVHVWWGDDRYVPVDHPLSNVQPFEQWMLRVGSRAKGTGAHLGPGGGAVAIRAEWVHPIENADAIAHARGAGWAAARYAEELRDHGPAPGDDGWPVLDVFVLGIGPDGHILSVFPGSPAFDARDWVLGIPAPSHVEPHVERVTLNPALVGAARRVVLLATGGSKAEILGRIWAGGDVRELPARAALLGQATWVLDEAAAAAIER